ASASYLPARSRIVSSTSRETGVARSTDSSKTASHVAGTSADAFASANVIRGPPTTWADVARGDAAGSSRPARADASTAVRIRLRKLPLIGEKGGATEGETGRSAP